MLRNLFILSLLISGYSYGQSPYVLHLSPEKWNIFPDQYYISEVKDQTHAADNDMHALINGKQVNVIFENGIETDLFNLINSALTQDTSRTALTLSVERFIIKETGTTAYHKATLDFEFKILRIAEGKTEELFDVNGKPEITMRGNFPQPHEKNIASALKSVFADFDKWISEHPDIPPLAKTVKVILDTDKRFIGKNGNDTVQWDENLKLEWKDFQGSPNSEFNAQSNCLFDYRAEPFVKNNVMDLHIDLIACFEKKTSWVKAGSKVQVLLDHEQLHFDICELNVRLLRKKILSSGFTPLHFADQIKVLFNDAWNAYHEEQEKYDSETQHGTISSAQLLWQKNIQQQIIETSEFKNSPE